MIATHHCPECGGVLPTGAPEGLCPQCLLREGMVRDVETPAPSHMPTDPRRAPFAVPEMAELASHFPQLEILELLGQGGMGAVYKARQVKLHRPVALKVLPLEAGRDPAFAERFTREARALARLNHPHIVTVHDFGESDGLYYFLMEYVDGRNLRQLLSTGWVSAAEALRILSQVCDALEYAHGQDIVHRDIKPENILLDRHGRAKIADFGLAKLVGLSPTYLTLTGSHQVMGTLYYMAPEQMERPATVDRRADVYSLGVVLYELLTGELPVGRFAPPSRKVKTDPKLDEVVLKALAKEPDERYQSAAEFKQAIEGVASGIMAAWPAGAPFGSGPVSVPFSTDVTMDSGTVYRLSGLMRFDGQELALEFRVHNIGEEDEPEPGMREVRVPLGDLVRVSLDRGWFKPAVVITTSRLAALEGVPGAHGRAKLHVARHDLPAAIQFVAAVNRRLSPSLFLQPPAPTPAPVPASPSGPGIRDPELVRIDVQTASAGLLLTALLAFGAFVLIFSLIPIDRPETHVVPVTPVPGAPGGITYQTQTRIYRVSAMEAYPHLFMLALVPIAAVVWGGWRMRRFKSYEFAIMACILAMIPWSPAWIVGLFAGAWGLWVLRRAEVRAAFAQTANPYARMNLLQPTPPAPPPVPPRGPFGRLVSFFRSAGGYMFDTTAAPRADLPSTTPPMGQPSSWPGGGNQPPGSP